VLDANGCNFPCIFKKSTILLFVLDEYEARSLSLKHSGDLYIGHITCFNVQVLCILSTKCIYRFRLILRINSNCLYNSIIQVIFVMETLCLSLEVGSEFFK
jgi:hypothetical protein